MSVASNSELSDRTAVITARLKQIYRKSVLPVEKRYKYDYFYESPLLTDVEFDGTKTSFMNLRDTPINYLTHVDFCSLFFFESQTAGTSCRTV